MAVLITCAAQAQSLIRDAEIERTLERMTAPVLRAAGLQPETVDIYILFDRSLNAFVAGGRNIFLHTGLLLRMKTPEMLLGVVAHEAGHITGGHLARRAIQLRSAQGPAALGCLIGIAVGVAGGAEAGSALCAGTQQVVGRSLLKFNRAEEASADQAGLDYLIRARIDPEGLREVMELFRGQEILTVGNIDPYVLTHPLFSERLDLMERRIADAHNRYQFAPDAENDYWHARMRAKLEGFIDPPERVLSRYEFEADSEAVLYARAIALHRLPAPDEAVATMDRLIALRPNDAFYWELKGQILYESGRGADAVEPYRRALRLAPDEPLIAGGLGRALLALDEPGADREALAVLQEARRADFADPAVLRDLALAYARTGQDGMAALATAERFALVNRIPDAIRQARRAAGLLAEGSPGWLRAQDILALDQN